MVEPTTNKNGHTEVSRASGVWTSGGAIESNQLVNELILGPTELTVDPKLFM